MAGRSWVVWLAAACIAAAALRRGKDPGALRARRGGTPQDWRYFIEHLDRSRYQPWVYYYPSGLPLEVSASWLNDVVMGLHARHGMQRLVVAAHSTGGLVARRFVVLNAKEPGQDYVRRLITLATPWDGVAAAGIGAIYSPLVVPSWLDVAPDTCFVTRCGDARRKGDAERRPATRRCVACARAEVFQRLADALDPDTEPARDTLTVP
jgi:hypothetical protein